MPSEHGLDVNAIKQQSLIRLPYKFVLLKLHIPVKALFLPMISSGKKGDWILPENRWSYQNGGDGIK